MNLIVALAPSPLRDAARPAVQPGTQLLAPLRADQQAQERLAERIASQMEAAAPDRVRQGGAQPDLREPGLSLSAAQAQMASLSGALASALQVRSPLAAEAHAGADRRTASPRPPQGAWMVTSSFSQLLAMLRELLLRFEKMERDQSTRTVMMSRETTIQAGKEGVKKATEIMGGAIGGTVVMSAVGAAGMQQSIKASRMQTNSMAKSELPATRELKAGVKGHTKVKGASALNVSADRRPVSNNLAKGLTTGHNYAAAEAQTPIARAYLLNQISTASNGLVTSGVNIQAEMTEAERQMSLHVVDVQRRIADEQQDQANKTRDQRDATAQLVDTLLNLMAATSGHVIGRY